MEEYKELYQSVLDLSLQFERCSKLYNKIIGCLTSTNLYKLQDMDSFSSTFKKAGKENRQTLDLDNKEFYLLIKDANTHYQLRILNKNIATLKLQSVTDTENKETLDDNNLLTLDVSNYKTGKKYLVEIVLAKEGKKYFLVEKDWSWSANEGKWEIDPKTIEATEEINTLLGNITTNQI